MTLGLHMEQSCGTEQFLLILPPRGQVPAPIECCSPPISAESQVTLGRPGISAFPVGEV